MCHVIQEQGTAGMVHLGCGAAEAVVVVEGNAEHSPAQRMQQPAPNIHHTTSQLERRGLFMTDTTFAQFSDGN